MKTLGIAGKHQQQKLPKFPTRLNNSSPVCNSRITPSLPPCGPHRAHGRQAAVSPTNNTAHAIDMNKNIFCLAIFMAANSCTNHKGFPTAPRQIIEIDSTAYCAEQMTNVCLPCNVCGTFVNAAFVYDGQDVVILCRCGNKLVYAGSGR